MFDPLVAQLLTWSLKIKNQTQPSGNTETLVGGLFEQIVLLIKHLIASIVNVTLGIILKGELLNFREIESLANSKRGDTWRAIDTGHYWCYDGARWNDIGVIIPSDVATKSMVSARTQKTITTDTNPMVVCPYEGVYGKPIHVVLSAGNIWVKYQGGNFAITIVKQIIDVPHNHCLVIDMISKSLLVVASIEPTNTDYYLLATSHNGFIRDGHLLTYANLVKFNKENALFITDDGGTNHAIILNNTISFNGSCVLKINSVEYALRIAQTYTLANNQFLAINYAKLLLGETLATAIEIVNYVSLTSLHIPLYFYKYNNWYPFSKMADTYSVIKPSVNNALFITDDGGNNHIKFKANTVTFDGLCALKINEKEYSSRISKTYTLANNQFLAVNYAKIIAGIALIDCIEIVNYTSLTTSYIPIYFQKYNNWYPICEGTHPLNQINTTKKNNVYFGDKLDIGCHEFKFDLRFKFENPTSNTSSQSCAYYAKKIFQFYGNSLCEIYDYKSGALIESRTDIAGGHCSCAFFGDKLNAQDTYPILFISDGQPSRLQSFNINQNPAVLLQSIDLTGIRKEECIQCVDFKTKTGWNITYVEGDVAADGNYMTSDYRVTPFDAITGLIDRSREFIVPRIGVLQSCIFINEKIIITTGWDGFAKIAAIDTIKQAYTSEITTPYAGESQGLAVDSEANLILSARGNHIFNLKL